MKIALCLLLLVASVVAAKGGSGKGELNLHSLPGACQIVKKHSMIEASTNVHGSVDTIPSKRVIAIGDVHGSLHGLLTDLFAANITESPDTCKWKQQPESGVMLVQVGDIVDRGPQALEAFQCLQFLQSTASTVHSRVVRLVGSKLTFTRLDLQSFTFSSSLTYSTVACGPLSFVRVTLHLISCFCVFILTGYIPTGTINTYAA